MQSQACTSRFSGINIRRKEKRSARLEEQEAVHGRAGECRLDLGISKIRSARGAREIDRVPSTPDER